LPRIFSFHDGPFAANMSVMQDSDARLLAIGGAVVLAALVGLTLLAKKTPADLTPVAPPTVAQKPAPPPSPAIAGATPAEAEALRNAARVDPSELYPKAKARAIAWDRNAELSSLVARRVMGNGVNLSIDGAEIKYTFRIPRRPVPLGQPEPADRYVVSFTQFGVSASEERSDPAVRLPRTEEPTCTFRDAMKNAIASGISELSQIDVRFEMDQAENRGVWRIGDRAMDGKTCAMLRRR
jgi:hypothetical protein